MNIYPGDHRVDWEATKTALQSIGWLKDFQRPYFLRWIRLFLESVGSDQRFSAEVRTEFIRTLRDNQRVADWQRQQAERAIR